MRHSESGVVPVDKPAGVSSRGVVDVVARALGTKTVGHAGTLDPLARGVVLVCVGHATKLVDYLHELPKRYAAEFLLGRSSPSDDLETPVEEEVDPVRPTRAEVDAAAVSFRGDILQRPCDFSAVHVEGKRAYRLARKGKPVTLEAKPVRIDRLEIVGYQWPRLDVEIECSSGTFVRAIGRDLAESLGTRAVMAALVRTAVGPFALEACAKLDAIVPENVRSLLLPTAAAVPHLPRVTLDDDLLPFAVRGFILPLPDHTLPLPDAPAIAALDTAGGLVGILKRLDAGRYRLRPNFLGTG